MCHLASLLLFFFKLREFMLHDLVAFDYESYVVVFI